MELVYLWVEDYKNIHRQGFNFSPRFNCHYDGEILTIKENVDEKGKKQYIENFFGDNINVTAIVGKNGSGKSSILRALKKFNNYHYQEENIKFILCLEINNKINVFSSIENIDSSIKNIKCDDCIKSIKKKKYLKYESDIENKINIFDCYLYSLMSEDGYINDSGKISNLAIKNSKENFTFELTTFMCYPKIISLSDNEAYKNKLVQDIQPQIDVSSHNLENRAESPPCYNELHDLHPDNSLQAYMINIIVRDDMCDNFFQDYNSPDDEKVIQKYYNESSCDEEYSLSEYEKLISSMNYEISTLSAKNKELISKYNKFMLYDYEDKKGRKFSDLSHGEKSIYAQFIIMYDIVKNRNDILFAVDEPDLSLHPEWQRRYIHEFMNTFSKEDKKLHLVFTSHSPFLLSDIPKQSIIFLDKDKDGNCKVVDGLKEKKQTFGANIHTLLSDSFFMEDGFMGEFAKGKINEIIEFFDNKNELYSENKERLYQIINAIGEPFLKEKLLFMYGEKFPKTKEEQIAEYEAEIKRLKSDD